MAQKSSASNLKLSELEKMNSSFFNVTKGGNKLALYKAKSHVILEELGKDLPPKDADKRKCTDLFCLLSFLVYVFGVIGVSVFAFSEGDPRLLIYGSDNQGRTCGTGDLSEKENLVWPRFTEDIFDAAARSAEGGSIDNLLSGDIHLFGVCVESCPDVGEFICTVEAEEEISLILAQAEEENQELSRSDIVTQCINSDSLVSFLDIDVDLDFGSSSCKSEKVRNECFEALFNHSSLLFRCFPEFVLESEIIEDETGCTKSKNVTNFLGQVEEKCLRYRTVTKVTQEEPTETDVLFEAYNTGGRKIQEYLADLFQTYNVIVILGLTYPLFGSLVYITLMWFFAQIAVWFSVFASFIVTVTFTVFLYFKAGILDESDLDSALNNLVGSIADSEIFNSTEVSNSISLEDTGLSDTLVESTDYKDEYEVAAYIATALTVLLFLVIIYLIPKIKKAIEFFKEASKNLKQNMCLLFIPLICGAVLFLSGIFFFFATAFALSIGDIEFNRLNLSLPFNISEEDQSIVLNETLFSSEFVSVSYTDVLFWFLFLGFLWVSQLIAGMRTMTISGAIADSYYNNKYDEENVDDDILDFGFDRLKASSYIAFRFHLGSAAFGGLVIGIVQFFRMIAAFISERIKDLKEDSRMIKYFLLSVHCFLRCVEKCIEYVSKHAYTITAMHGNSFCRASKTAFSLISANFAQVSAVAYLSEILIKFGQIMVSVSATFFSFIWLDYSSSYKTGGENEINSLFPSILVVFILSWITSGEILGVYNSAIDTILMSYCYDKAYGVTDYNAQEKNTKSGFLKFMAKNEKDEDAMKKQQSLYAF
eukprot:augustus_masked-scaffold_5-processed-gene-0.35-mRNA-1 protein AED:0.33 eAED:0.35 QI:0/-1/0/1/-1/1/1/0/819